uniref:Uncharacterized protein n=2 Tax=Guillardia theta TaxID=55529 RepID=A0A7S4KN09_GUITH|mmetsp:Transcript_27590/g.89861  ORF Transcript_27590/g.89861 Transcript_27590/m.89861 type:complete len:742 (+) Transcript_27590:61-2286(+)
MMQRAQLSLLGFLVVACAAIALVSWQLSDAPVSLLGEKSSKGPADQKQQLIHKLDSLLKSKAKSKALEAEAVKPPADQKKERPDSVQKNKVKKTREDWQRARPDWKPYDPSLTLSQNQQLVEKQHDDKEQGSNIKSLIKKVALGESPSKVKKDPSVVRYEGNMRSYNPHDACKDWAVHPIDCIRKAYHNHLKGTKFQRLRRRYDGHVTEDSLDRERNLIAKKVSEGYIDGALKVPKHGAVRRWLRLVKKKAAQAKMDALKRAAEARLEKKEEDAIIKHVSKFWGSGIVTKGHDAGRRYYINYADGTMTLDPPAIVKRVLGEMRLENKEKKQQELEEEAAMYKKGFRDAQKQLDPQAFKHPSESQGSPDVHSQEQAEALHVINRFLQKSGRSPTTHHLFTSDDLAKERAKVAHELGYKSLMHGGAKMAGQAMSQKLTEEDGVPLPLSGGNSLVVVDARGKPLTAEPTAEDYPMMNHESPAGSQDESNTIAQGGDANPENVVLAKAVKEVAQEAADRTNALQSEVEAQQAIIKELESQVSGMSNEGTKVSTAHKPQASAGVPEVFESPASFANERRKVRDEVKEREVDRVSADLAKVQAEAKASLGSEGAQKIMQAIKSAMNSEVQQVEKKEDKQDPKMIAKPSLGSWEMAKFANNVEAGGGSLGTNVAWMYDSLAKKGPYAQVANEDTWEDDSDMAEYKTNAQQLLQSKFAIPRKAQEHMDNVASRELRRINKSAGQGAQLI